MKGIVYIVGAGPGDYGLMTLRGKECIEKADVIVYDRLINKRLLNNAKPDAEKIYVGKRMNNHSMKQSDINVLLVEKAKAGKTVVRLKGGDPFVFGRGGEEAFELSKEDITYEIIPGISSSIAAPAYAGIPVTHRALSTSFHIITAHEDPTKKTMDLDYSVLAKLKGTLLFLMGTNNLKSICDNLIENGKDKATPAALVYNGTTTSQHTITGTLLDLPNKALENGDPGIIIVGETVKLREELFWFEKKPLFGRRILVTRTTNQAGVLSRKIEELGGEAIEFPVIQIEKNEHIEKENIYNDLNTYKWIIFTSVNGVKLFFDGLIKEKGDIRAVGNAKICAIGIQTEKEILKYNLGVEFTPKEFIGEALADGLKEILSKGDKILIPRAQEARELLVKRLQSFGALVKEIPLYNTIIPECSVENLIDSLDKTDIVTFTSASTVKNFINILGNENLKRVENKEMVCIGPITAEAAKEAGLKNITVALEYTIDGIIEAIKDLRNGGDKICN